MSVMSGKYEQFIQKIAFVKKKFSNDKNWTVIGLQKKGKGFLNCSKYDKVQRSSGYES